MARNEKRSENEELAEDMRGYRCQPRFGSQQDVVRKVRRDWKKSKDGRRDGKIPEEIARDEKTTIKCLDSRV